MIIIYIPNKHFKKKIRLTNKTKKFHTNNANGQYFFKHVQINEHNILNIDVLWCHYAFKIKTITYI